MVERSADIASLEEARAYYGAKLARAHCITSHSQRVTVVFERDATHLFSVEANGASGGSGALVRRHLRGGGIEDRIFDAERARRMDDVLPALSCYTVSISGTGPTGREKRLVHGPRLPSGMYMRVVVRRGPGEAYTCVSAYAVSQSTWLAACRAKRARFP